MPDSTCPFCALVASHALVEAPPYERPASHGHMQSP